MNDDHDDSAQSNAPISDEAGKVAVEVAMTAADDLSLPLPASTSTAEPRVVSSAVWTVGGFAFMQVLRFVLSPILTRLVSQYVFGVINLANLFIQGLHMFSDLGIRQCVVNSSRGEDPEFLNTAWTLQVLRGTMLGLLSLVISWPLAWFWETPQLLWLVPMIGTTAFLEGWTSHAVFTMIRHLERAKLVIRDVAANAISMSAAVLWLWLLKRGTEDGVSNDGQQMFAFATCNVFSSLLALGLSYTLIRGARHRFTWDSSASRELIRFAGWIAVSTACTFLADNLDRFFFAKLSIAEFAIYHIAGQLARLPSQLLRDLGHQLAFPLYSRLMQTGVAITTLFAQLHLAMTGFAAWLTSGAFAVCPTLIWLVYSEEYRSAGDYVRWLSVGAWFTVLQTSSEVVLLAQGHTRQVASGQFVKLVLLAPLLLAGLYFGGFIGIIIGYTLAEAARYVVLSAALAKQNLPVFRLDLALTLLVAITAGVTILVGPYFEGPGGKWSRYGLRFLGESTLLTLMWGGIALWWWRGHGRGLLELTRTTSET